MHSDMHLRRLFHLLVKESLVCFPSERKNGEAPCRYHVLLTKRSHVASSPSAWIDKDFWFQSSPFSHFSPLSLLSLPLSSFILCIFGIERLGETERERAIARKITEEERKREKEIALVWKARFSFPSSSSSLIWPLGAVTQSWLRPERAGCVPFRWRNRKRQGWSKGKESKEWDWCCWPRGRGIAGRLWLRRRWSVQRRGSGPCGGGRGGWGRGRRGGLLPGPQRPPASPYWPPQDWKEAAGHHWLLGLREEKTRQRV